VRNRISSMGSTERLFVSCAEKGIVAEIPNDLLLRINVLRMNFGEPASCSRATLFVKEQP